LDSESWWYLFENREPALRMDAPLSHDILVVQHNAR
jgi:hypothetical protein